MISPHPARLAALQLASAREVRTFDRAVDGKVYQRTSELFGVHVFGMHRMEDRLPRSIFKKLKASISEGAPLPEEVAEPVAEMVKQWAVGHGATHFCHWFQPMTGLTAEKHDAFIVFDEHGRAIEKFTGAMLVQSEPDASSFPSGGMRTTFEARGYTAWDPTTPMFLMDAPNGRTLCIPSVFVSYTGHALDKKTPVLRSIDALGRQASRLVELALGERVHVKVTLGCEQEYFLVDEAWHALRPDLVVAGRSLVGAPAPKGQSMEDHYFGAVPPRVAAFMQEVEFELYKLGVPAKTRHNEVAPGQFELAQIFVDGSVAVDHNLMIMEVLRRVAPRHHFRALLHEKPFAEVNGSGKHANWSLADSHGTNLLDPGTTPHENVRFLIFLTAVLVGVHRHAAMLRASVATYGNDFRLGANEAPPAIISVFLGDMLTKVVQALVDGSTPATPEEAAIELGVARLPRVNKDNTDRNRTSPFAFTGNKFEFRAVGASQTPALPLTALNTAVADGLAAVSGWIQAHLDAGGGRDQAVMEAIRRGLTESTPVRFEGNNYAPAWVEEAARRGLPNLPQAPQALETLMHPSTMDLFERHQVLTRAEQESRYIVRTEQYVTTAEIEAQVLRDLVDGFVLPAALAERAVTAAGLRDLVAVGADGSVERELLAGLASAVDALVRGRRHLEEELASAHRAPNRAEAFAQLVVPAMAELRQAVDALEGLVADGRWPLPKYRELLFQSC